MRRRPGRVRSLPSGGPMFALRVAGRSTNSIAAPGDPRVRRELERRPRAEPDFRLSAAGRVPRPRRADLSARCWSRRSCVAYKAPDAEKLSAYECGFNPFDDARMKFDVRFYLVSLLFIIFDLEVAFLFPWAVAFHDIGAFGFWSMMLFLGRADDRLRLRMEQGSAGMGLSAGYRRRARARAASSIPRPASRSARTIRSSARSTTNSPTRASSSPRPTISSNGRARAR